MRRLPTPRLDAYWHTHNLLTLVLRPLACVFCLVVRGRLLAYRNGLLTSHSLPVPVVVVGNISVGGTGKTPLVIWLAQYWRAKGWRPGILTRGYLGAALQWPQVVVADSDPQQVGDESVILARRSGCPVVASPNRLAGGQLLVQSYGCNLVLCDDGLQHYALKRDVEIAVIDGVRRLGNGLCLPAGPLREPVARLRSCDVVVTNGSAAAGELGMILGGEVAVNLQDSRLVKPLTAFRNQDVLAIAGIGNPQRFFTLLQEQGLQVQGWAFPDHHPFRAQDFTDFTHHTILMTEKDAVKCERFVDSANAWYVPVQAVPEPALITKLDNLAMLLKDNPCASPPGGGRN